MSIKCYRDQLEGAVAGRAELRFVESWHDEPGFVGLLADRIRGANAHVVFTAHSLPARILDSGDPYHDQLLETSRLVAEAAAAQASGTLPRVDTYGVVLSKQPTGPVTYQAVSDGSTEISLDGTTWGHTVSITFLPAGNDWDTMRVVYVRAVDDTIAQGLHFSEITQGVDSTDAANLYGLTASDVAAGLAADAADQQALCS